VTAAPARAAPDRAASVTVAGRPVPPALLGPLADSTGAADAALAGRLAADGYVLVRGALDRAQVQAARAEVFGRLAAVGEVAEPAVEGIATGTSRRAEQDLDAFWRTVSEGPALRRVTHGGALAALAARVLGAPALPFDFLWVRAMVGGRASPLHFDHSYMNRGSARVVSAWVPLGDVPVGAGPIAFVEGSHGFADLIAQHRGRDVDREPGYRGSLDADAVAVAQRYGMRLLTTDFRAGDVVLFGMFTLHGSLDNNLGGNRIRLSCDVRYQPASDARDERWFGAPPPGHGNKSYGGLSGAQPLGSPAIKR